MSLEVYENMLRVWHLELARADRNAVTNMVQKGAARDLNKTIVRSQNNFIPCVEEATINNRIESPINSEVRPGIVLHTKEIEMNVPSASRRSTAS